LIDTTAIPGVVTGVYNIPDLTVESLITYPNPFSNDSYVSFKLRRPGKVTIEIFDLNGKKLTTAIDDKFYLAGKYTEKINIRQLNLAAGSYIYRILINGNLYTRKLILLN
jgi:hypothetical protein